VSICVVCSCPTLMFRGNARASCLTNVYHYLILLHGREAAILFFDHPLQAVRAVVRGGRNSMNCGPSLLGQKSVKIHV